MMRVRIPTSGRSQLARRLQISSLACCFLTLPCCWEDAPTILDSTTLRKLLVFTDGSDPLLLIAQSSAGDTLELAKPNPALRTLSYGPEHYLIPEGGDPLRPISIRTDDQGRTVEVHQPDDVLYSFDWRDDATVVARVTLPDGRVIQGEPLPVPQVKPVAAEILNTRPKVRVPAARECGEGEATDQAYGTVDVEVQLCCPHSNVCRPPNSAEVESVYVHIVDDQTNAHGIPYVRRFGGVPRLIHFGGTEDFADGRPVTVGTDSGVFAVPIPLEALNSIRNPCEYVRSVFDEFCDRTADPVETKLLCEAVASALDLATEGPTPGEPRVYSLACDVIAEAYRQYCENREFNCEDMIPDNLPFGYCSVDVLGVVHLREGSRRIFVSPVKTGSLIGGHSPSVRVTAELEMDGCDNSPSNPCDPASSTNDPDADQDGMADPCDLDDDNDGFLDNDDPAPLDAADPGDFSSPEAILAHPIVAGAIEQLENRGVEFSPLIDNNGPEIMGNYFAAYCTQTVVASSNNSDIGRCRGAVQAALVPLESDSLLEIGEIVGSSGNGAEFRRRTWVRGSGTAFTLYGTGSFKCGVDGANTPSGDLYRVFQVVITTGEVDPRQGDFLGLRTLFVTVAADGRQSSECNEFIIGENERVGGWVLISADRVGNVIPPG